MITRRNFSKGIAAAGGSILLTAGDKSIANRNITQEKKKNVLFIVMDQERSWATLPKGLKLPARENFAKSGVSFDRYNISSLSCGPTRSVIYTGHHVQKTRLFNNPGKGDGGTDLIPEETPTLGQHFKNLGYKTAYKGKWHLSSVNNDKLQDYTRELEPFGFDEWQEGPDSDGTLYEGAKKDASTLADAVNFLERQSNNENAAQPWFLAVNFVNPHDIMWLDASGKQAETRLKPGLVSNMGPKLDEYPYNHDFGFDVPDNFKDDLTKKPDAQRLFIEQAQYFYGIQDMSDPEACRRVINYYAACLIDSDKIIQNLLDKVSELKLDQDTIVILTSDHGEMAGAHGLRHKGPFMYRENLNVPLVIRHPEGKVGITDPTLFSSLDIVPTLLGLVVDDGYKLTSDLRGVDQSSHVINKGEVSNRSAILVNFSNTTQGNPKLDKMRLTSKPGTKFSFPDDFVQFEERIMGRGIITKCYKFSRWFSPSDHHLPKDWYTLIGRNDLELYDTQNDPLELHNLANNLQKNRKTIMKLNFQLNQLVEREVGDDLGAHLPGDKKLWSSDA